MKRKAPEDSSSTSACVAERERWKKVFDLRPQQLWEIADTFSKEIQEGIQQQPRDAESTKMKNSSSLDCLVTYLGPPTSPSSSSSGGEEEESSRRYVAIDLGGTNLRVLLVDLGSGKGVKPKIIKPNLTRKLTKEEFQGTKANLFGAIAQAVKSFFVSNKIDHTTTPVGFTFSFPFLQTSRTRSQVVRWSKEFVITDAVDAHGNPNCDPVEELGKAMEPLEFTPTVAAIINDTTGTLLTGALAHPDGTCDIGMILGTGTNICMELPAKRVTKEPLLSMERVYINLESGNFDKNLPLTNYDKELDQASTNPKEQQLEKLVSGRYLGMLAIRILTRFYENGWFLHALLRQEDANSNPVPEKLSKNLTSEHLSDIIRAENGKGVIEVIEALGFDEEHVDDPDVQVLQELSQCLLERSARLSVALILGAIQQIEGASPANGSSFPKRRHVVAIDGSLFSSPVYYEMMQRALMEMLGDEKASWVTLESSNGGSGIGAAIAAAVAVSSLSEEQ